MRLCEAEEAYGGLGFGDLHFIPNNADMPPISGLSSFRNKCLVINVVNLSVPRLGVKARSHQNDY